MHEYLKSTREYPLQNSIHLLECFCLLWELYIIGLHDIRLELYISHLPSVFISEESVHELFYLKAHITFPSTDLLTRVEESNSGMHRAKNTFFCYLLAILTELNENILNLGKKRSSDNENFFMLES